MKNFFITGIGKIKIKWRANDHALLKQLYNHYKDFIALHAETRPIIILEIENNNYKPPLIKYPQRLFQTNACICVWHEKKILFFFPSSIHKCWAEASYDLKYIKFYNQGSGGQLLKYLFPELLYSLITPKFGGILLHACGIAIGKRIFVFVAQSGGGKSTIAKLALKKGYSVLNDDRIILRKVQDKYFVFGTPWCGEVGVVSQIFGELKEVYFLKKVNRNFIEKVAINYFFRELYNNTFYLPGKGIDKKVLDIILNLGNTIKGYDLGFVPNVKVWRYLSERRK